MESTEMLLSTYTLEDVVSLLNQTNQYLSFIFCLLLIYVGTRGVILIAKIIWYFLLSNIE